MKQICMVLEAVKQGAETSDAISALIGLPVENVSAYLTELTKAGLIRRNPYVTRRFNSRGRRSHVYEPVEDKP